MMFDPPRLTTRRRARPALGRATWKRVRQRVLLRDGGMCRFCGAAATVAAHLIPPDRYPGHHDDPANLVAACWSCNNSMADRTVEEWYAAAGKPLPEWYVARVERTDLNRIDPATLPYHEHRYANGRTMLLGNMAWSGRDFACPEPCGFTYPPKD